MIGQTLRNRYRVTAQLGKGAMGLVYRATDRQTRAEVALKVIARDLALQPEMLVRFRREGEALRQLRHRNIVAFVDMFTHQDQHVIVMEYVGGGNLHGLIRRGSLPVAEAVRIALELSDALAQAHHISIVHRDIKPENVLVSPGGTPKLTDFGVARLLSETGHLTGTGALVGTPYYMSPEAWQGKPLDAQADVWSLGVMLYEMVAGQVPFGGDTLPAVMNKVLTEPPPDLGALRSGVPAELVSIVERMLVRDKAQRYRTMRQLAADLEQCVACVSEPPEPVEPKREIPPLPITTVPLRPAVQSRIEMAIPPTSPPLSAPPSGMEGNVTTQLVAAEPPRAASRPVLALGGLGVLTLVCLLAGGGLGVWTVAGQLLAPPTVTLTRSPSPTVTPTHAPAPSRTITASPTLPPTATSTGTFTLTPTFTEMPSPTLTATATRTVTRTPTRRPTRPPPTPVPPTDTPSPTEVPTSPPGAPPSNQSEPSGPPQPPPGGVTRLPPPPP